MNSKAFATMFVIIMIFLISIFAHFSYKTYKICNHSYKVSVVLCDGDFNCSAYSKEEWLKVDKKSKEESICYIHNGDKWEKTNCDVIR